MRSQTPLIFDSLSNYDKFGVPRTIEEQWEAPDAEVIGEKTYSRSEIWDNIYNKLTLRSSNTPLDNTDESFIEGVDTTTKTVIFLPGVRTVFSLSYDTHDTYYVEYNAFVRESLSSRAGYLWSLSPPFIITSPKLAGNGVLRIQVLAKILPPTPSADSNLGSLTPLPNEDKWTHPLLTDFFDGLVNLLLFNAPVHMVSAEVRAIAATNLRFQLESVDVGLAQRTLGAHGVPNVQRQSVSSGQTAGQ